MIAAITTPIPTMPPRWRVGGPPARPRATMAHSSASNATNSPAMPTTNT